MLNNFHFKLVLISLIAILAYPAMGENTRGITLSNSTAKKSKDFYGKSYAIVIGVDKYKHLNTLNGAVRDARNVANALQKRGFEVVTLINENASKISISELLGDKLPARLKENDRILIYFAGHGVSAGSKNAPMGYLMPIEGDAERIRTTGISMRELQAWFADYSSKHVLFVADSCYSGLALSTRSTGLATTIPDYYQRVLEKPVRIAMTAGGAGELANEWRGEGLFTHYFLKGLEGSADANNDNIVTSSELISYVRPQVAQTARDIMRADQNPQIGRRGEGEFLFIATNNNRKNNKKTHVAQTENGISRGDKGLADSTGMPEKLSLRIEPFTVQDKKSSTLEWLAMKTERNLAELFSNNSIEVYSKNTSNDGSKESKTDYIIKGDFFLIDEMVSMTFEVRNKKGTVVALAEIEEELAFLKQVRKAIPETIVYLMDIDPYTLKKKKRKLWPTKSVKSYLLYLESRRKFEANDIKKSVELMKASIEQDNKFALGYWSLGRIYQGLGEFKLADEMYASARKINPDHIQLPLVSEKKLSHPVPELLKRSRSTKEKIIAEGFWYRRLDMTDYGFNVDSWKFRQDKFSISVTEQNDPRGNAIDVFLPSKGIVAINGGFFEMDRDARLSPSGLMVINGVVRKPVTTHGGSGVLSVKSGKVSISYAKHYDASRKSDFALQSGPVLVDPTNKLGIYRNDFNRKNRTAICLRNNEVTLVVVSASDGVALSLYELAVFLQNPVIDGGLECDTALNLDGGPSTSSVFNDGKTKKVLKGLWRVQNAISIAPR